MEFFTVGNLLTLGIVILVLVLYRQMDKNSRNLKLLRDYSERVKKELGAFVEEKEKAVRDYGVSLNVERDSAKELMRQLIVTEEELAEKAAAVARIDNQIKSYESSLLELDKMAGRVQENMNRIRDESSFVESAGKRIGETKNRLEEITRELSGLESRFEKENAESLSGTAGLVIAAVKSEVAKLEETAVTLGRRAEAHRQAVDKIEQARSSALARDTEHIARLLKNAVEQAGKRADRMEEAALVNLKEQAENRISRLKTAEEEKLRTYQESARARVAEAQALVKNFREEWRAERSDWETRDKAYRDERRKEMQELSSVFADYEKRFAQAQTSIEKQMNELKTKTDALVSSQETMIVKAAEDMKQRALEITGARLEEYHRAQEADFRRLESLADDSRKLDSELRLNMREVVEKVRADFSLYEQDAASLRKAAGDNFAGAVSALRAEMKGLDEELSVLKSAAYDNVSEKLKVFEDDFFADIARRSRDIDNRFVEWQENLESRLAQMGEEAESGRRGLESRLVEEMRKNLSLQDERLISELEHLKTKTGAFEEGIRERIDAADESVTSFKEYLKQNFDEARKDADVYIKSEISKQSLAAAETIKQYQRESEAKLREMSDYIQSRSDEITELVDASRSSLNEARDGLASGIRELDDTIEDARLRVRDLSAETDTRIAAVRSSVEDAERHIREAVDQAKLIDRAEELRTETERRIEDLKADIDRIEQRRAEAAQLENDFIKIKRLEDDVNSKMTRFLSEKRRIETMEADFNRLIHISHSVEEKLAQITASDDTLQGIQLQIRKLEDAFGVTEDKYQRMERKNQILDNTNDGIDRNFRALQESEKISSRIDADLARYADELGAMKDSVTTLAKESEKAKEAVDRIDVLDNALEEIEERITAMQRARQWIADAETRLEGLNKQAQVQARAIDAVVKGKKSGVSIDLGEGAPPQQKKENVIMLARQGWKVDEIAKTMKISRGEVELILEMAPKD